MLSGIKCLSITLLFCFAVAQAMGGAVLINTGGTVDLSSSIFLSNDASGSASEIVNLGGEVQCDPSQCLPVCTSCRREGTDWIWKALEEDDVDALPRSRVADRESTFSGLVLILLACALVALALLGVVVVWRRRPCAPSGAAEQETAGIEMRDGFLPLLDDNPERAAAPMLLPVEMRATEAPAQEPNVSFAALRSSPAPIFGIDTAMRIVLWSRGEA